MERVIIVAGHAICIHPERAGEEKAWVLLDFQGGEVDRYLEHIETGVRMAAADPEALLVFAGGYSRAEAGPRSEGASYYWVAAARGWWGHPEVADRAITEEFSRDSFENLLYGICRAREFTGRYPAEVAFVSWRFKGERFELHREAIGWPRERYRFVGVNDPPELARALAAEARTAAGYREDPYSSGPAFRAKRDARNPFRRTPGYALSCPEVAGLLAHEGPVLYRGGLPWRFAYTELNANPETDPPATAGCGSAL